METLQPEKVLLYHLKFILPFLKLSEIAKTISLSKTILILLSKNPYIILYIIKKYYLNIEQVHPSIRRFFKFLLTKRLRVDREAFDENQWQMYSRAIERILISRNMVRNPYGNKGFDGWIIDSNRGNGWGLEEIMVPKLYKYSFATSFDLCRMHYEVKFEDFSLKFLKDFLEGKVVIKAGCFISRRADCAAIGGCMVAILNGHKKIVYTEQQTKRSEELPMSWKKEAKYEEISFIISINDLQDTNNIEKWLLELMIEGRDRQFWQGWYGARFWGMYVRGDFADKYLENCR